MSDLARRRDAREYWVSRGHLHAGLVASLLMAFVSFGFGFLLGQSRVGAATAPPERVLLAHVPGEDLVALLAEVERGTLASASSAIVYPELIEGEQPPALPAAPADLIGVDATLAPPPRAMELEPDPVPPGVMTVQVGTFAELDDARRMRDHLLAQQVQAWWSVERVDGAPVYRVAIGGFLDAASAEAALVSVAPIVRTSPVTVGAPEVVPIERAEPVEFEMVGPVAPGPVEGEPAVPGDQAVQPSPTPVTPTPAP
jgi:hypothetical protein